MEAHESADQHVKTLIQVEELDAKELGRQSTQEECAESERLGKAVRNSPDLEDVYGSCCSAAARRFRLLFRSLSGKPMRAPISEAPSSAEPGNDFTDTVTAH